MFCHNLLFSPFEIYIPLEQVDVEVEDMKNGRSPRNMKSGNYLNYLNDQEIKALFLSEILLDSVFF